MRRPCARPWREGGRSDVASCSLPRADSAFDRAHAGSVIVNEGNTRFFEPGALRSWLLG